MTGLILVAGVMVLFGQAAGAVEIEPGARIGRGLTQDTANALAGTIRAYGYRCDSISAITTFTFERGVTVKCNNWSYVYEVEDKVARIVVTFQ